MAGVDPPSPAAAQGRYHSIVTIADIATGAIRMFEEAKDSVAQCNAAGLMNSYRTSSFLELYRRLDGLFAKCWKALQCIEADCKPAFERARQELRAYCSIDLAEFKVSLEQARRGEVEPLPSRL